MTDLLNMSTGEVLSFSIPPKEALRVAFEISRKRTSSILPGLEPPLDKYHFTETPRTIALGDFCYLKE